MYINLTVLPLLFWKAGSNSQEKSSLESLYQPLCRKEQLSLSQGSGFEFDKSAGCLEQQIAKNKAVSTLGGLDSCSRGTFAGEAHLPYDNSKEQQGSQQLHANKLKDPGKFILYSYL